MIATPGRTSPACSRAQGLGPAGGRDLAAQPRATYQAIGVEGGGAAWAPDLAQDPQGFKFKGRDLPGRH